MIYKYQIIIVQHKDYEYRVIDLFIESADCLFYIMFCLKHYNCIGFDLDYTLCMYKLENIINLQYKLLVNYLVRNNFSDDDFCNEFGEREIGFLQKGLFLDFQRGNILKLSHDASIFRASHGTQILSKQEVNTIYEKRRWTETDSYSKDILEAWEKNLSTRCMTDFSDIQVPLVFAQAVDALKKSNRSPSEAWPIVLEGVIDMFREDGSYYRCLKENPALYISKTNSEIITWLKHLKQNNILTFVLTGSRKQHAEFIAEYALGKDWRSYFDFVIYDAKKPGFFTLSRAFINLGNQEFLQGNWKELNNYITDVINAKTQAIYIGDNFVQDVIASTSAGLDAIVVIPELCNHFFSNRTWGELLHDVKSNKFSFWGDIVKKNTKLSVHSLLDLTQKPLDYAFQEK